MNICGIDNNLTRIGKKRIFTLDDLLLLRLAASGSAAKEPADDTLPYADDLLRRSWDPRALRLLDDACGVAGTTF